MKFLSLERLAGPGRSLDENFEIMSLELIKAEFRHHESFRLSAPDGGIDIYSRAKERDVPNIAFQCKAYPTFKSNLLQSVAKSARTALSSIKRYPWNRYMLIIPFVPTGIQRIKLEEALDGRHRGISEADRRIVRVFTGPDLQFHIIDGDELEATLYRHPSIARRFFPTTVVITPSERGRITLGFPDDPSMLQIELRIYTWEQVMPVTVTATAKAGSLLQMLIGQLALPVKGSVARIGGGKQWYDIKWELILEGDPKHALDLEKTLPEQNVFSGAVIALRYSFSVAETVNFFGGSKDSFVGLKSFYNNRVFEIPEGVNQYEDILSYWINKTLKVNELTNQLMLRNCLD